MPIGICGRAPDAGKGRNGNPATGAAHAARFRSTLTGVPPLIVWYTTQ